MAEEMLTRAKELQRGHAPVADAVVVVWVRDRWFPCFRCDFQPHDLANDPAFCHSLEALTRIRDDRVLVIKCTQCGEIRFVCMCGACTATFVFCSPATPGVQGAQSPHTGPISGHLHMHRDNDSSLSCKFGCGTRFTPRGKTGTTLSDRHRDHHGSRFCIDATRPIFARLPAAVDKEQRENLERNTLEIMMRFKSSAIPSLRRVKLLMLIAANRRRRRRCSGGPQRYPLLPPELYHLIETEFMM